MSESVYMAVYSILWNILWPQKGDENEEIYIFTGLYILDELETKINILFFIIVYGHINVNLFKSTEKVQTTTIWTQIFISNI